MVAPRNASARGMKRNETRDQRRADNFRDEMKRQCHQRQREALAILHKYDKNGDGAMQMSELKSFLQHFDKDINPKYVSFIMIVCDKDGNCELDPGEFVFAISLWQSYIQVKSNLEKIFQKKFPTGEIPINLLRASSVTTLVPEDEEDPPSRVSGNKVSPESGVLGKLGVSSKGTEEDEGHVQEDLLLSFMTEMNDGYEVSALDVQRVRQRLCMFHEKYKKKRKRQKDISQGTAVIEEEEIDRKRSKNAAQEVKDTILADDCSVEAEKATAAIQLSAALAQWYSGLEEIKIERRAECACTKSRKYKIIDAGQKYHVE